LAQEAPPPDVAAFIRFCHARRRVGWPELYDEMCGVAGRREFHGWGHDQLAAHGVTFCLPDLPRLAGWVRTVLASVDDGRPQAGTAADLGPSAVPDAQVAVA
jgi:hypothetical protein